MDAITLLILGLLICQTLSEDTCHVNKAQYKDGFLNIHNNASELRYKIDVCMSLCF